jgi:predicted transcriptional regulator
MSVGRRTKYDLYFEILESLQSELKKANRPSPTRISRRVNMPYDRFQKALEDLVRLGLIDSEKDSIWMTEKGVEYITEYRKFSEFLRRMGMLPDYPLPKE